MGAKELVPYSNLRSSGSIFVCSSNADDVKPTIASSSVYTTQQRDIKEALQNHMGAKESTVVNSNLCSSGSIFKCFDNVDDVKRIVASAYVYTT